MELILPCPEVVAHKRCDSLIHPIDRHKREIQDRGEYRHGTDCHIAGEHLKS